MNGLGLGLTDLKQDKVAATISCADPAYTSDFSADADGWSPLDGVAGIQFNQDAIGGLDDNMKIRFGNVSPDGPSKITKTLGTACTAGCEYSFTIKYWVYSGNDEVVYVDWVTAGGINTSIHEAEPTNDAWVTKVITFTAVSTTTEVILIFNADHDIGVTDAIAVNSIILALN